MVHIATDVVNKPELAIEYLEDQIFDCLLNRSEPVRTGEVMECIGSDLPVTPKLIRRIMTASDRFAAVDRRWDVAVKFMDSGATMHTIIQEVIATCGKPVTREALTRIMASITGRPEEVAADLVDRMIRAKELYFITEKGEVGLREWLLDVDYQDDEELRFQNFDNEDELTWAMSLAGKVKWDPADLVKSSADFLKIADRPVTNKTLSYLCWKAAGPSFKSERFFSKMESDARVIFFAGALWATKGLRVEFADLIKDAAESAEELPAEAEMGPEETADIAPAAPPEITASDLEDIYQRLSTSDGFVNLPPLVEDILEVSPGERGYAEGLEALQSAMTGDERFMWVGANRWRLAGTAPDYVAEIPEMLRIPALTFETPEGERLDLELEDEGLEGGLSKDIESPLVQDIPVAYDGRIKYVLTYPHFHSGTMPTLENFFPGEPGLVEVTFKDQQGNSYDSWINNGLGLAFGLEGWFETADLPISGAIFHVDRTERPDEFALIYAGETDPMVYLEPARIMELEEIGEEAGEEWSAFDIIRSIMEERKGIQFVTLFTEVNIIRRVSPRLIASILSSYHCFYQKQAGTSIWLYDERKLSQGFKKTKRKYIRK